MFSDFFYLGKVTKHFGLQGEVVVLLDTDEPEKYYSMELVYLDIEGEPIPFFIENIKVKQYNKLIIKFADVDLEYAQRLADVKLYLPLSQLPKLIGNQFYYHEVIGFEVEDVHYGKLGILEEVLEYPAQAVFKIKQNDKEILMPVVDPYIKQVDREHRKMTVETPEGLVDLYLNE